jgi:tetratricopeptide (TPR) repeat protein
MSPSTDASVREIIICDHCGNRVDEKVPFCPTCGYPLPEIAEIATEHRREEREESGGISAWWWLMLLALFVGCVLLGILGAGLFGVYDGLKERAVLNQQTAEEHYQRGLAHLNAGEYELAVAEFDVTLRLDPGHVEAARRLREAEALAFMVPTPTSAAQNEILQAGFTDAQELYRQGRWEEVIAKLEQVRSLDPTYQADQVQEMLYGSYYNQGLQLVEEGRIEEAYSSFGKALEVWPDQQEAVEQQRLASLYVKAKGSWGGDWAGVVEALTQLYNLSPNYRDVAALLPEAHARYGDLLASQADWCLAQQQYEAALHFQPDPDVESKRDDAADRCGAPPATRPDPGATPAPAAKTPRATVAPSEPITVAATSEITATPEISGTPEPAVGTGQGKIYYAVKGEVKAVPAGGGESQIIFLDAAQPAVDPSGRRIAYKSLLGESIGIHAGDAGGGNDVRITNFAEDSFPSWSPGGDKIALASNREGDRLWRIYMIYVTGSGGSESVSLGLGTYPAWSPKGDFIAYRGCNEQGGECGLYLVDSSAVTHQRLTMVESDTAPAWSPDGSQIAFMSAGEGNWEIYLVGADGSGRQRLTFSAANDLLPVWSPAGGYIAFVSDREGGWAIYVVSAAGGEPTKVADIEPGWAWQEEKISWGK